MSAELWTSQPHRKTSEGGRRRYRRWAPGSVFTPFTPQRFLCRTLHAEFGVTTWTWRTLKMLGFSKGIPAWSLAIIKMTAMVLSNPAALTSPNMPNIAMWRGSPESHPTWAPLMLPHPIPSDMHMLSQQCSKKNIWLHAFPSLTAQLYSSAKPVHKFRRFKWWHGYFQFFHYGCFCHFLYILYSVQLAVVFLILTVGLGIVAPESHPDLPALPAASL